MSKEELIAYLLQKNESLESQLKQQKEEAQKKEISKDSELLFLISHGILHLLGFDHQTQEEFDFVVTHQKEALKSIGIIYDKI